MRRLIEWIYRRALGLQVRTHQQHIADLENHIVQLCGEQAALIDAQRQKRLEIDAAIERLLAAHVRLDAISERAKAATYPSTTVIARQEAGGETVSTI